MERRPLGTSGLAVSPIAIGTETMGGDGDVLEKVDDREAIAALHLAIDCGVNLIDTAPTYGMGQAEELIGKAIQGLRKSVVIATKCGLLPTKDGAGKTRCLERNSIVQECEQSLRRLKVDAIDLYSCHRPDADTPLQETMEALTQLREQGKIRAIGLANFGCERAINCREYGPVHAVQAPFSMLHRRPREGLIPFGMEHEISFLGCAPLAKGLLTGQVQSDSALSQRQERDPDFIGSRFARNLSLMDELRHWADGYNKSLCQFAINWAVSTPGVTSVIVGVNRPSQVQENIGALGWTVSDDDRIQLDSLLTGRAA